VKEPWRWPTGTVISEAWTRYVQNNLVTQNQISKKDADLLADFLPAIVLCLKSDQEQKRHARTLKNGNSLA
jgi:hypothetical protein